jgi:Fe-S cluster biogenesis protein NfuA
VNVDAVGQRVEELLDQIAERDEVAAELVEDVLRELLALYGAGLARILDGLQAADPDALDAMAADPLVGGLMMLHDLHPDDPSARVQAALEEVRPYLASHGGGVQLLEVSGGVARLRLEGSCDGCGSSQVTLQHAVQGAVLEAAPEIERIESRASRPQLRPV